MSNQDEIIELKPYYEYKEYNDFNNAKKKYLQRNQQLQNILASSTNVKTYISANSQCLITQGLTPMNHWHVNQRLCNCWTWHKFGIQSDKCEVCCTWAPISSEKDSKSFSESFPESSPVSFPEPPSFS